MLRFLLDQHPTTAEKYACFLFRPAPDPSLRGVSFVQVVREKLCELEIPHKFISSARGSPKVRVL